APRLRVLAARPELLLTAARVVLGHASALGCDVRCSSRCRCGPKSTDRSRARGLPVMVGLSRVSSFQSFLAACAWRPGSFPSRACCSYVSRFLGEPVVMVILWEGLLCPLDLVWSCASFLCCPCFAIVPLPLRAATFGRRPGPRLALRAARSLDLRRLGIAVLAL